MNPERNEDGATLIEGAIVASLLMVIITGIMGGALYIRTFLAISNAANAGARAGAIAASDTTADFDILSAAERDLSAINTNDVVRVVVFKAVTPGALPNTVCGFQPAGAPSLKDKCNVYSGSDFKRPEADFGIGGWTADNTWAASTRKDSRLTGRDYVGVQITAKCGCFLEQMGFSSTITKSSTIRIESRT